MCEPRVAIDMESTSVRTSQREFRIPLVTCLVFVCFGMATAPQADGNQQKQVLVPTSTLAIELMDGFSPVEGRVMVFADDNWRALCDDEWGIPEADVTCRQLGLGYATMAWRGAHFGDPAPSGDDMRLTASCEGTEKELAECSLRMISAQSCGKFKTAGVRCANISQLRDSQIRLIGGATPNVGWVQLYHDHHWSVICDEAWEMTEASVVCRELGYNGALAAWGKTLMEDQGPRTLQNAAVESVDCSGIEEKLADCEVEISAGMQCQEPATVTCQADRSDDALPYQIRLSGSKESNKGRVEVFIHGAWGTVCDDNWNLRAARVVCKQLGYPYATAAIGGAHYGEGTGDVMLGRVDCTGHETHLLDCGRVGLGATGCQHDQDAGVVCSVDPTLQPPGSIVRLSDGSSGFVEVFHDGQWWRICSQGWNVKGALVVCYQQGYHSATRDISAMFLTPDAYSRGSKEDLGVLLNNVRCLGDEDNLAQCQHDGLGPKACGLAMAGVDCAGNIPPRPDQQDNSLRLSDGTSPSEGRVELYLDGAWATVCSDHWDMTDAEVVCRQLGFTHATSALVRAHFGPGSGPIALDEVQCIGDEDRLTDCRAERRYHHDCQHRQDAGVRCDSRHVSRDYSVRLSGGASPNAGRVEVLLEDHWHTVCDVTGNWGMREAEVVCRELGFPQAVAPWAKVIGEVMDRTWRRKSFPSVECLGNETRLAECRHGVVGGLDCGGLKHEGRVLCQRRPLGKLPYSVRLQGGDSPKEGKVEISQDERWYPVCGDQWDLAAARVVCKQLGYQFARSTTTVQETTEGAPELNHAQLRRTFPHVQGLSGFRCTGHEDHILECNYRKGQRVGCGQGVVAQVTCSDKPSIPPGTRLRLGGDAPDSDDQGRVEVYHDGLWWKVCADDWDMRDATVVCRQLGYPVALAAYSLTNSPSNDVICDNDAVESWSTSDGRSTSCDMEYLMSDLQCTGNETGVVQCRHAGFGRQYCSMEHDAAVACDGKRTRPSVEVRLGTGSSNRPYEGRVEVHHGGQWWVICNTVWDHNDAEVLCHQLGFPGVGSPDQQPVNKAGEGGAGMRFLPDDVQCDGTEANIAECLNSGVRRGLCKGKLAAGVRCSVESLITQGEAIRLVGGDSVLEGRVEIYHDRRWWTICDDNWDIKAADVACRQLGLPLAESAIFGAYYGRGHQAMGILLDEVECDGSEGNLLECSHHVLGHHDCDHAQDAGVRCAPPTLHHQLKLPKPIRLAGGSNSSEGRIEIYHSYRWWTVCGSGNVTDDINAALVACQQLEFPGARAVVPADNFKKRPRYTHVLMTGLNCRGTERNLTLCRHREIKPSDIGCDDSQELAVQCLEDEHVAKIPGLSPAHTRRKRSGPTTPVLAVIIATVFVTGFMVGSLILYHVYKACERFLSDHPAVISGDAVRSPNGTASLDRPEVAREAREKSARNKDMFIELYPLPPVPGPEDSETDEDEHEYSDWGATPIRRDPNAGPPPNTPDIGFDGTMV